MKHTPKTASFFVFPMLVLLGHLIASKVLNLYAIFPSLDIPFHYLGGLSIAWTSTQLLCLVEKEKITIPMDRVLFLILGFCLTATAAVFWEFAEFLVDRFLGTNIQVSLANTMQDQFMGILGGASWTFIVHNRIRDGKNNEVI